MIWFRRIALAPFLLQLLITIAQSQLNLTVHFLSTTLPYGMSNVPAVYDGQDSIYLFGGVSTSYLTPTIYKFSIHEDGGLTEIVPMPDHVELGSAIWAGNENIFYFGGGQETFSVTIWKMNTSDLCSGLIHTGSYLPHGLFGSNAIWDEENNIYLIGGESINGTTNKIYYYSKVDNYVEELAELPMAIARASSIWDPSGCVYIFGGINNNTRVNDILEFDPNARNVTKLNVTLPEPISDGCSVWIRNQVYIIGATTNSSATWIPIIRFDPFTQEIWPERNVSGFPYGLTEIGCAFVEKMNRIYLFGGNYSTGFYSYQIMYIDLNDSGDSSTTTTSTTTTSTARSTTTTGRTTPEPSTCTAESNSPPDSTTSESDSPSTPSYPPSTEPDPPTTETVSDPPTTESNSPTTESDSPTTETESDSRTTESDSPTTESNSHTTKADSPTTDSDSPTTEFDSPSTESISSRPSSSSTLSSTSTSSEVPTTIAPSSSTTVSTITEPISTPFVTTTSAVSFTTDFATTITESPPSSTTTGSVGRDCSALDKHGTHFEANVGEYSRNKCPGKSTGISTWLCLDGGIFNGTNPDYSNCSSLWLSKLEDIIAEGKPISVIDAGDFVLHMKQNLTYAMNRQDNITCFGHEIKSLFRIGENVLDLVVNSSSIYIMESLTSSTFSIYSQLLRFTDAWEELSPIQSSDSGTAFITATDNSALSLANRLKAKGSTFPYRKTFDDYGDFKILSGLESTDEISASNKIITFPETYNPEQDSYVEIPNEWIENFSEDEFVSFSGLELSFDYVNKLFPANIISNSNDESTTTETEDENSNPKRIINSKLMSFTFNNPMSRNSMNFTENGVKISFRHDVSAWGTKSNPLVRRKLHSGESAKTLLDSGSCAYWDTEKLSWSTDGCSLVSSERDFTVCECNHLTSFALIMDLHNYIGKDLALELLTLILCPISIICLILTLAIFTYSRHKRQILSNHPRNEFTFHLCLSLLIGNLLMLITMDKHYLHLSDGMCIVSAIILHYVLLCAFSWMALEGILLSKLIFIDVFSSGREFIKYERTAAFAIPGIIVIITCAINFGRGDHGYGNDSFCWLDGNYLFSFIVPVGIVVTFNTIVLIMSIRKSYMVRNHSNFKIHRDTKSISFWIRGSLSLTIIMGVTWIFGFLMLINNSTMANIAAYIFTLLNASQGIFIFIFHIVLNEKIRTRFSIFTVSKSTWGTSGQTNVNSSPQSTKNVSSRSATH